MTTSSEEIPGEGEGRDINAEMLQMHIDNCEARFNQAVEHTKSFQMQSLFAFQGKVPLDLSEGIRLFYLLDFTKTNTLTKKEIQDGCTDKIKKHREVIEFLDKYEHTPFGLLKKKKKIDKVFDNVDRDKDGKIQLHEWKLFLADLIERDSEYLVEKGWAADNCYWARQPPTEPEPRFFFFTTSEWISDFYYFELNNNPLLGIFFADKNNSLKTLERLNIEFCCESWAILFTALLAADPVGGIGEQYVILFFVVTLPTVAIRNLLLYCFKCPCLIRRHHMGCWRRCCIPLLQGLGHIVGFITFILAILALILGILIAQRIRGKTAFWTDVVVSVAMSFVYGFISDLFIQFNPFVFFRRALENHSFCCCSCHVMGLAQWQMQRKQALAFYRRVNHKDDTGEDGAASTELVEGVIGGTNAV
jgi:hypothetical protein